MPTGYSLGNFGESACHSLVIVLLAGDTLKLSGRGIKHLSPTGDRCRSKNIHAKVMCPRNHKPVESKVRKIDLTLADLGWLGCLPRPQSPCP